MKVQSFRNDEERTILTALIVNSRVLAKICDKVTKEPFRSKWSNLVFSWCQFYFKKYQKAPRHHIQSQFSRFAEKSQDEATVQTVEKFLSGLSEDYRKLSKELNEDFLVDTAARYFTRVKIEKQNQAAEHALERGDVEEAERLCSSFLPITLATDDLEGMTDDRNDYYEIAHPSSEEEVLIKYPHSLGEFFGAHLQRDGFIAFLAPEKRGKSQWLLDMAWRAAYKNRRRTIFYSVGDMSLKQVKKRILTRIVRRPIRAENIWIPRRVRTSDGQIARVRKEEIEIKNRLTKREIDRAIDELEMKTAQSTSPMKLRCTPNSTTKVADIEADIEDCIRQEWVPDVVVIDYADILAPERILGDGDFRHQTDETWKALRRLSQKYHILVVTATQSNAISYKEKLLHRWHFAEDKRKLAHVTGMVGINQLDEEKKDSIFRLNWILLREGFYAENRVVTVAGCLEIANPCMVSAW